MQPIHWSTFVLAFLSINAAASPLNVTALDAAPYTDVFGPVVDVEKRAKAHSSTGNSGAKDSSKGKAAVSEHSGKGKAGSKHSGTGKAGSKHSGAGKASSKHPGKEKAGSKHSGKNCKRSGQGSSCDLQGGGGSTNNAFGSGSMTDINCSAQACNSICYAALCSPGNVATGLYLERSNGNPPFKTSPLVKSEDEKETYKGVPTAHRTLSGCGDNAQAKTKWTEAGLKFDGGSSPDEWPPNSAESGGLMPEVQGQERLGVPVHTIARSSNTGVGSFLSHGHVGGHMRLLSITKDADICYAIMHDNLNKVVTEHCGKDDRFGQWNPETKKFQKAFAHLF